MSDISRLPCAVVQAAHCQKTLGHGGKWELKSIRESFPKVWKLLSNSYKGFIWVSRELGVKASRTKEITRVILHVTELPEAELPSSTR